MEAKHTILGGRKLAAIALSALISAAPVLAQQSSTTQSGAQSAQSSAPATSSGKHARRHHKKWGKELGLTKDQKKQLKGLRQDQRKQVEAVRNDSSLSQDQKAAKLKEIHKSGMEKRDAIMTPEQREKLKHLRDENEGEEAAEHSQSKQKKSGETMAAPAPQPAPQTPETK